MNKRPSTSAWIAVHLLYPLLPFVLEGFIRFVATDWKITVETFSASTLAISTGLMAVFVNQSLRTQEGLLPDQVEVDQKNGTCALLMALGIIFFAFFGLITLTNTLVHDRNDAMVVTIHRHFEDSVFALCLIPFVIAIKVQRAFKLRASLA